MALRYCLQRHGRSFTRNSTLRSFSLRSRRVTTPLVAQRALTGDKPFEEETDPDYYPEHFLQVSPGEIHADGQYQILTKLGWGRTSTVWLAKDLRRKWPRTARYVSIKFINCDISRDSIDREYDLLQRLSTADLKHRNASIVRTPIDNFEIDSPHGTHACLVYEPLRETRGLFRRRFQGGLPLPLIKGYVKIILVALDYLHTKCNMVHTDLKLDNILMTFENNSVMHDYVQHLGDSTTHFKDSQGRRIFETFHGFGALQSYSVSPIVADFGLAQVMPEHEDSLCIHPIQPDYYRAPEVLLGGGWSYGVDIWNLGVLTWYLASGSDLFTALHTPDGIYEPSKHLAQMISLLGPPPPNFVKKRYATHWKWSPPIENHQGRLCEDIDAYFGGPFFDPSTERFLYPDLGQAHQSIERSAGFLEGNEKTDFVDFMTQTLRWNPGDRPSARELKRHAWLDGI